jgi:serine/threonine protein kinase
VTKPPKPPSTKRYLLREPIGHGGMGTVNRADDRVTGQPVAIKVLKATVNESPMHHRRLAQEFRAAAQLEHPNIVRAIEVYTDGWTSCLVYEFVEGEDLAEKIIKVGRLPEDEAVRVITQIAQALQYAHLRQVIHRDVKPDNIMVLPDGRAKLTDFGLAKDYNNDMNLTRHASGLGTPNYMAPEQFADAKTAGVRCDVYSLGATLYSAVTGRLPFEAKAAMAILAQKEKTPPSARAVVPGLSESVDEAIRAALQPDAENRPESCLEFFKLLTARPRSGGSGTVPQPKSSPESKDRRAFVRHPLGFGSCAAVETGALVGGRETEELWPLIVQDVSATGVGVMLARRFEPGTELTVELSVGESGPRSLPARVVRVVAQTGGHWAHGCLFTRPLSKDELSALLQLT